MPDYFVVAAPAQPSSPDLLKYGCMMGSIGWDEASVLKKVVSGIRWREDELDWRPVDEDSGKLVAPIPEPFAATLAALPDDRLDQTASAWFMGLCTEFPRHWNAQTKHALREDLDGLRTEAREAVARAGSLWVRIDP
jgi:hypothetical protein